jgi:tetratricopeptide (TPR) repeat protein
MNRTKGIRAAAERQPESLLVSLRSANWYWGLLLVLSTILAYQLAWHAGFIWDDDRYVTQNRLLTAPDGLKRIWFSFDSPSQYFPLVYTVFRVEHVFWGLNSAGYHWVNILLHSANALLVWRLFRMLRIRGAWLAAALFALHPVQVESVAWITELKNVLMGFFFLLALLAWVKFLEDRPAGTWKYYALAFFFYALALLSKSTACTLPAALVLILWLKKKPIDVWRLAQVLPFVALGLGMGLLSIWWERYHQGTQAEFFKMGFPERILLASRALWFYAGKLVWPAKLTFSYPRWPISAANPFDYLWLLVTAGFLVVVYFARRLVGRSLEVAALFFAMTLSPMLGFIMLFTFHYSFVADHYQYLACLGPLTLAAAGLTKAFDHLEKGAALLRPIVCGAFLFMLGALSWRQCAMYRDWDTLWRATLANNPRSWMAHNNLALSLQMSGRLNEAVGHYLIALQINPGFGERHYNLANALAGLGRSDEAVYHYEKAIEMNPKHVRAYNNLAFLYAEMGKPDKAITNYMKALESDPNDAAAHNNLGGLLLKRNEVAEAVAHLRKAIEIDPAYYDAHYNLGNALLRGQHTDEALIEFRKAIEIDPSNAQAHRKLGNTLLQLGQFDEGSAHLEKARQIESRQQSKR